MNFLKKGPELKLSEIRVPGFAQDIYYDLKDRHLLPIAALLIVAIVAVPFVLGQSSSSSETSSGEAEASVTAEAASSSHDLVATSMPGLRKYQRRLDHLHAKDPFKQQYTKRESTSGGSGGSSSSTGSSGEESAGTEPTEPATETESPGNETVPSGENGEPNPNRLRYYSYAIDVRVSSEGTQGEESQTTQSGTPKAPTNNPPRRWTTRHNLPELTMLPSRQAPAVIYMGSTKDAKKALMLVSSDVTSIFGDSSCVLGSSTCELLAMEPGVPETFVYGAAGRVFKIELLKVHLVETKKLNRAPLGKPKKNGKGS